MEIENWIDDIDEDLYLSLKMMVDLYTLIHRKDVNHTILYVSRFLIKNNNDVIGMFSIYQRVKEIYLIVY